jgi:hypothetical protein
MQDITYKILDLLDYIVDSGNMILVQCVFLLLAALLLAGAFVLAEVNITVGNILFAVSLVPLFIAGELWLYHRGIRGDSFR